MHKSKQELMRDILIGVAIGDALGVPVEFKSRQQLRNNPITSMIGFGTYNQVPGTWSDDTSMTLCLAESLLDSPFDIHQLANRFINWYNHAYWTAHNNVFDIGGTTHQAINNLENKISPLISGPDQEESCGNGSLMRILPLVIILNDLNHKERFKIISEVSGVTHGHIVTKVVCYLYLDLALNLISGKSPLEAYLKTCAESKDLVEKILPEEKVYTIFSFFLDGDLHNKVEMDIQSTGYAVYTLEAAVWCLLNSNSYSESVLKAVNLGGDTDTTAAVCGGLAGILYGYESIPKEWMNTLVKREEILKLADEF